MSPWKGSSKLSRLVPLLLAVVSGAALFMTAQAVQDRRAELASMREKLAHEREALRVFQAEWAYLNRPQRLERLAKTRLDLQPPTAAQMLAPGQPLPIPMHPGMPPAKPEAPARVQPAAGKDAQDDGNSSQAVADRHRFDGVIQSLKAGQGR